MANRNIVVIGASAGGVMALTNLVSSLPNDFNGYIFVVLHLSPFSPSIMPQILSRAGSLKAVHPRDGEKLQKGKIYIAPPDHHILLEEDKVLVKKGPKENRFRPSIDALFRSAAYTYGSRVIGMVLSGLLDDGTSGLWSIKRQGGLTVVQDPNDAEFSSMPQNALEYVEADYLVPVKDMAALLCRFIQEKPPQTSTLSPSEQDLLATEVQIASQDNAFNMGILEKGPYTPLTCPECSGALVQFTEGKIIRYRCHTGHAFTDSALLAGVTKSVEDSLWKTIRGMEEAIIILQQMGRQYETENKDDKAGLFFQKAKEIGEQSQKIRKEIFHQERFSEDLRFNDNGKEHTGT